ncbi:DASH family cryptochrome [Microdochium nivale]|nr:DASH family cryptochrome [Microdochium nivale]
MPGNKTLVYLFRHDLRVADNPILHRLAKAADHGFTHFLPLVVLTPQHLEVSGFLRDGQSSPYPPAKSELSGLWRCGLFRAKFIGESIMNLKSNIHKAGSQLTIKVGKPAEVVDQICKELEKQQHHVDSVWTIDEEGTEEKEEEAGIAEVCAKNNVKFELWIDEKYYIDDRDLKYAKPQDLPDVFTTYRKTMEPLREKPRKPLPKSSQASTFPPVVPQKMLDDVGSSFTVPDSDEEFLVRLLAPVKDFIINPPPFPEGVETAHPFKGGESAGLQRLDTLIRKGYANQYKATRNGLLGEEFSTKLSAYLAQGCITARQIHASLLEFENGTNETFADVEGYGKGENEGTKGIRFELLWRDYMRLCNRKFKHKLFYRSGFRDAYDNKWKVPRVEKAGSGQAESPDAVQATLKRLFDGTTGMGFIDASQRELIHTGYTSNRARQNVASFLSKHLNIDWRFGAEYYEMLLVDYDVSSNWANWQYVAGVGNDPRGEARIFNPVKQAFDYDKDGAYVRAWVPEVRELEKLENVFQAWTTPKEDWDRFGLTGLAMAEDPVLKINFSVEGKPKNNRRPFNRRRGQGRGSGNGNGNGDGGHRNGDGAGHGNRNGSTNGHSPKSTSGSQNHDKQHMHHPPHSYDKHQHYSGPDSQYGYDQHHYFQAQFVGQGVLPLQYGQPRTYPVYYGNGGNDRGGGYYGMRGSGRPYRGRGGGGGGVGYVGGGGYGGAPYRGNYYGPPSEALAWQPDPYGYSDQQMPPW